MSSARLCVVLAAGAALLAGACQRESAVRRDDVSAVVGSYERPEQGAIRVETATLIVTQQGMTFEDAPYRESVPFTASACDGPSCKVSGGLCAASLEKRADGNLFVTADKRCHSMAGVWYSPDNAKKVAAELASASPPPIAAPPAVPAALVPSGSASPAVQARAPSAARAAPAPPSASAHDPALSLSPDDLAPAADRSCLRRCSKAALSCAKGCAAGDALCLARCNAPTAECAACLGPR